MSKDSNPPSRWADLRDVCSAIRELVVVIAMILLITVPSIFRTVLERAGIRSVAGVEFDMEPIAKTRDELDAALEQIATLQSQLSNAHDQVLGLVESTPADPLSTPTPYPGLASSPNAVAGAPVASMSEPNFAPGSRFSPSLQSVSRLLDSMKNQTVQMDRSLRRSKDRTDEILEQSGQQITLTPPEDLFRDMNAPPESASLTPAENEMVR